MVVRVNPRTAIFNIMRERELTEFFDIHAGETAWVFGKGPTLDSFNFADAGKLRIGINDLVGTVPGCLYGFSNDHVGPWRDLYNSDQVLFTPKRTADYHAAEFPDCDVCVFSDYHGHDLNRDRLEMCKELQIRDGSLGSALQVLHIMGVKRIVAVGIDGGGKHSKRVQWRTALVNEHYKQYNVIRQSFIEGAGILGIELQFYNEREAMENGYKTVQFTSNTFVRGNPYAAGMIVRLIDVDALDVIQSGKGIITKSVPEKKKDPLVIETATAERPREKPERRKRRTAK